MCSLAMACALSTACSFAFVRELKEAPASNAQQAVSCTTSRALPAIDLAIGALMGGLVAGVTYSAVDSFNDECAGGCGYHPWKPSLLAAFLVVSPWWISSAVGFSDTGQSRAAYRARGIAIP